MTLEDDIEEMGNLFNYLSYSDDNKLADKIDALLDDPDDRRGLLTVISLILD